MSEEKPSSKFFNLFGGWNDNNDNDQQESSTRDILNDKILAQDSAVEVSATTTAQKEDGETEDEWERIQPKEESSDLWNSMVAFINGKSSDSSQQESDNSNASASSTGMMSVDSLLDSARDFVKAGETAKLKTDVSMEDLKKDLEPVLECLKKNFSDLPMDKFDPPSLFYYLEAQDAKKNPSWKRRKHRFCPGFDLTAVTELHESLYLAELAYVDTVEEIQKGMASFQNSKQAKYELVYASTEGEPRKPANFLVLKKEAPGDTNDNNKSSSFPWSKQAEPSLEVTLVVRGTKDVADMLSDAMLSAADYRDGTAHEGIKESGIWLVEKHLPLLQHLLDKSQRKQIKLTIIGHSLGAGAAAIACMELNDQANIDVTCIAFCCPALVDLDTSLAWKEKITTIVADSDCVPRMSGATLYNLMIDLLELDYQDRALSDVQSLLDVLTQKVPLLMPKDKHKDVLNWAKSNIDDRSRQLTDIKLERRPIELYPPGKCYHLYRDGLGYSFVEVGCDFFDELDLALTMVDDHYVNTGCHSMFLDLMRRHLKNSKFEFPNDLMALRFEKPEPTGDDKEEVS